MLKKILIKILFIFLIIFAAAVIYGIFINFFVILKSVGFICEPDEVESGFDCILVPGCGVHDGKPSDMLRDRLDRAIELYKAGKAGKIIMSGDHGSDNYNEVKVMKNYAVENGIPAEDVFTDHAGFSTYESAYRAKHIFGAEKIIIVTQKYHLYRAIYDARALGLDASGTVSMPNTYVYQLFNSIREIFARNKDFLFSLFKPEPTYMGETYSLEGSGNVTDNIPAIFEPNK